ncbi:FK506-binding protein 5-like [Chironomus tepperi]|uniref:FK506-binding protein 5-like n=1 Tax=Chironomus tepperi TaxID=113505 RepID=UPI00391F0AB6
MGCASSSPLTVNGGPGGLVENAKTAATEIMNTGEKAINEVGENIAETVTQTKDTIVESINGVVKKKDEAITKIPLKDPEMDEESENHLIEENLENLKNEMLSKAQNVVDETDKIADELIKDTEDVIRDAETGIVDLKNDMMEKMDAMKEEVMDEIKSKSPTHSIDSLKTSVAEPEIEKLLNGDADENPVSPEATVNELENLSNEEDSKPSEEPESEPSAPPIEESMPESPVKEPSVTEPSMSEPEQPEPVKQEDDLVVEDIKSTDESLNDSSASQIGKKLAKSFAVDEESSNDESDNSEDQTKEEDDAPKTHWEEMHDIYFRKRFSRPLNASVESLMEDEEDCRINLSNMYQEMDSNKAKPSTPPSEPQRMPSIRKEPSTDTIEMIDELIKSIEKEVKMEEANDEVPIVSEADEN